MPPVLVPQSATQHVCGTDGCRRIARRNGYYCHECSEGIEKIHNHWNNMRAEQAPLPTRAASRLWAFVGFCLLLFVMIEIACCCMAPGSLR